MASTSQGKEDDGAKPEQVAPNQNRQDNVAGEVEKESRVKVATRGRTSMIDAGGAKEGVQRQHGN
jgi:hypothetical protein